MSSPEKIAIAAHLHVLLRRKTGRVTDTEWMATNHDYAHEVIRFAREKAAEEGHADLGVWAGRLEEVMRTTTPLVKGAPDAAKELSARTLSAEAAASADASGDSAFGDSQTGGDATQRQNAPRYVKGLR